MADKIRSTRCGKPGTPSFRLFFCHNTHDFNLISPWHGIQLFTAGESTVSFVCTTPATSFSLLEVAVDESFNPLRPVKQTRRLSGEMGGLHGQETVSWGINSWVGNSWNTGILPQTVWGDDDSRHPLELVEVGLDQERFAGETYQVKLVGACCVEEDGEMVWRLIGVAKDDSLAELLNDVEDLDTWLPGLLRQLQRWFSGLVKQHVLLTLSAMRLSPTVQKICESHYQWKKLFGGTPLSPEASGDSSIIMEAEKQQQELSLEAKMVSMASTIEDRKCHGKYFKLRSSIMKIFLPQSCAFVATVSSVSPQEEWPESPTDERLYPIHDSFWRRLTPKCLRPNGKVMELRAVRNLNYGGSIGRQGGKAFEWRNFSRDCRSSFDSNILRKERTENTMKQKVEMEGVGSHDIHVRQLTRSNTTLQERVLLRSLTEWE